MVAPHPLIVALAEFGHARGDERSARQVQWASHALSRRDRVADLSKRGDEGRALWCVEFRREVNHPKTRYAVRQVPLSPGLAQQLWTQLATADEGALVFATASGRPLDRSKLYAVARTAGKRAAIEWPVGLHTFRHTCASIMFRRGVPKEAIRRILGHHSWNFTAGTYLHLEDDDLPDGAVVGDLTAVAVRTEVTGGVMPAAKEL